MGDPVLLCSDRCSDPFALLNVENPIVSKIPIPLELPSVPICEPMGSSLKVISLNAYLYQINAGRFLEQPMDYLWKSVVGQFFETPDAVGRASQIARWIKKENPDVVLFQEVWQEEYFDQVLKESGYPHGIYFTHLGKGASDLAMIAKYPLVEPQFDPMLWQGSTYDDCGMDIGFSHRKGLASAFMMVNGAPIFLSTIHPMHRRVDEGDFRKHEAELTPERSAEISEAVLSFQNRRRMGIPAIFGGDFNFEHSQLESQIMDEGLGFKDICPVLKQKYPPEKLSTFRGDNAINVAKKDREQAEEEGILDHIYVSNQCQILDAEIAEPDPTFTDHQPVVAQIACHNNYGAGLSRANHQPLTVEQLRKMEHYFENLWRHPYCWFSSFDSSRIDGTLRLIRDEIEKISKEESRRVVAAK